MKRRKGPNIKDRNESQNGSKWDRKGPTWNRIRIKLDRNGPDMSLTFSTIITVLQDINTPNKINNLHHVEVLKALTQ